MVGNMGRDRDLEAAIEGKREELSKELKKGFIVGDKCKTCHGVGIVRWVTIGSDEVMLRVCKCVKPRRGNETRT
jgi:hypothetical protein